MKQDYRITPDSFFHYLYSKQSHYRIFKERELDIELYGKKIDPDDSNLKVYQDLFVFDFIKNNIPVKSKILDIGGGNSRILSYFKNDYECWNVDKLEGVGNGPKDIDSEGINLVLDYIGNYNSKLKDDYFDFVFSISTLEHTQTGDISIYENILKDIERVMKPNSLSLHLLDAVVKKSFIWTNPILNYLYENAKTYFDLIPLELMIADPDIYYMSEKFYEKSWKFTTGKSYDEGSVN